MNVNSDQQVFFFLEGKTKVTKYAIVNTDKKIVGIVLFTQHLIHTANWWSFVLTCCCRQHLPDFNVIMCFLYIYIFFLVLVHVMFIVNLIHIYEFCIILLFLTYSLPLFLGDSLSLYLNCYFEIKKKKKSKKIILRKPLYNSLPSFISLKT